MGNPSIATFLGIARGEAFGDSPVEIGATAGVRLRVDPAPKLPASTRTTAPAVVPRARMATAFNSGPLKPGDMTTVTAGRLLTRDCSTPATMSRRLLPRNV